MASIKLPFIKWREGRPRFSPGPRERLAGFTDCDLRHPDGRWFTLGEADVWARERHAQILAQRGSGKRLKAPPVRKGSTVADLIEDFRASPDFKRPREQGGYSDNGRADATAKLNAVLWKPQTQAARSEGREREAEPFATRPVSAIGKPEVKLFYEYLATARGPVMARGAIMWLSAAFQWGTTSGVWRLRFNPCHELDLPTPEPRIRIARDTEIRALVAAADAAGLPEIGDAIMLGLFTGQRQRDALDLVAAEHAPAAASSSAVRDAAAKRFNRFKQSKTGALVSIPETPALTARLAAAKARRERMHNRIVDTTVVIYAATGRRFNSYTFRHLFAAMRAKAIAGYTTEAGDAVAPCPSLADFHFQDLRDTAVTWYARAGSTVPEIAAITGHSMKSIHGILKHYLALDEHLADSAVAKLVAWMEREGVAV